MNYYNLRLQQPSKLILKRLRSRPLVFLFYQFQTSQHFDMNSMVHDSLSREQSNRNQNKHNLYPIYLIKDSGRQIPNEKKEITEQSQEEKYSSDTTNNFPEILVPEEDEKSNLIDHSNWSKFWKQKKWRLIIFGLIGALTFFFLLLLLKQNSHYQLNKDQSQNTPVNRTNDSTQKNDTQIDNQEKNIHYNPKPEKNDTVIDKKNETSTDQNPIKNDTAIDRQNQTQVNPKPVNDDTVIDKKNETDTDHKLVKNDTEIQIKNKTETDSKHVINDPVIQEIQEEENVPQFDYTPLSPVQTYDLVTLNSTSALCLDGSPAGYYVSRNGNPSKIFILFQGGAWCAGDNVQQTISNCYDRSKTSLGSTKIQTPATKTYNEGILSNRYQNYFKDWKKVFILYCDGAGHQGTKKDPIKYNNDTLLYFRGHNNTVETFDDLQKRLGLYTKAKKVVLSGESAGAVFMYTWVNYLKEKIKRGKLYAISDSGIFYHSEENKHSDNFKKRFANLVKIVNEQIDPPTSECVSKFPNEKEKCLFAQNLIEYVKVPLFNIQSVFDFWTLKYVWQVDCVGRGKAGLYTCTQEEKVVIEDHRQKVTSLLKITTSNPQNGVWGVGCFLHAYELYWTYTSLSCVVPERSGFTSAKAIAQWMEKPDQNNVHIFEQRWPTGNPACY